MLVKDAEGSSSGGFAAAFKNSVVAEVNEAAEKGDSDMLSVIAGDISGAAIIADGQVMVDVDERSAELNRNENFELVLNAASPINGANYNVMVLFSVFSSLLAVFLTGFQ